MAEELDLRLPEGAIGAVFRISHRPQQQQQQQQESPASASTSDSPDRSQVVDEARALIRSVVDARPHPPASILNRLASIFEEEEARYQEKTRYPANRDYRSSHTIGQLLVLIRDDDDFYEVLCSEEFFQGPKNLVAAGFRLILLSISTWGFIFSFRDPILAMVKRVIVEELDKAISHRPDGDLATEAMMTYAIGLFACQLSGGDVAAESLSTGQPVKFMRYLRLWTLGDVGKPDHHGHGAESKANGFKEGRAKKSAAIEAEGKAMNDGEAQSEAPEAEDKRAKKEGKIRSREDKVRGKSKVIDGVKDKHKSKAEQNTIAEDTYVVENVDISVFARRAVIAAQTEAKTANAPPEAVKAAGDAAAELVKAAALEALESNGSAEAALAAAENAAASVVDAAESVVRKQKEESEVAAEKKREKEAVENEVDEYALNSEQLAFLRGRYCVQCLEKLGEYIDILGPVLQERGVEVCVELLRRHSAAADSVRDMAMVSDVLRLVCALAAHRKFASLFVDLRGIQQLLATPRIPQTFVGISLCLLAVASLQGIMERVCALSPPVVHDAVGLALSLLDCCQDTARKNAALFMGAAFVFWDVIEAFESQDGLSKLLSLLRNTVNLRSGNASSGPDRSPSSEVLTASDKLVAFQLCVALKQYFRATFLILMDSLRPCKNHRGVPRITSTSKASCKPIDVSNEAVEAVIQQLSRDRKLGTAFLKAKWPGMDNFLNLGGHVILLELSQSATLGEKYLHDIAQHALPVLQLVTLIPNARRLVVSSTLGNGRPGMAIFLDAVAAGDHEVVQQALLVLINLVCPPPAFSSRSSNSSNGVTQASTSATPSLERQVRGEEASTSGTTTPLVGDTRISLGPASGGPGLASYIEQGYRLAREAVRANNGIRALLHLLYPRTSPCHDCIRALACRVLLGLARDDAIAQILTKLQVAKLLSELIRDGSSANRQDQDRWQSELERAVLDLMGVVTNAGRASTVASEAAAPTLRRIERAAIAAATPINYHSRELLQLIHEHLSASGLTTTAAALLKEAQLTPLDSLLPVASLPHTSNENPTDKKGEKQWPTGRIPFGSLFGNKQGNDEDDRFPDFCAKKRFSSKSLATPKRIVVKDSSQDTICTPGASRLATVDDSSFKTPVSRTLKRKAPDKDTLSLSPNKRLQQSAQGGGSSLASPQLRIRSHLPGENAGGTPIPAQPDTGMKSWMALAVDKIDEASERSTLDSLVVQFLKQQHRQCPAPITTLPPLSLLHPHVCPETSPALYAPYNMSSRLESREINPRFGGLHGSRRNRHFVYSRFRQVRLCRDERPEVLTRATFAGSSGYVAAGCHLGGIRIFDPMSGTIVESYDACHTTSVTVLQAAPRHFYADVGGGQVLLSSGTSDTKMWNSSSLSAGPLCTFENCKAAQFSHAGTMVGALRPESPKEVLLFDVNSYTLRQTLTDTSLLSPGNSRQSVASLVHFSPSDDLVLWKGILWDHRVPRSVHRFDQFSDYGGGGFHPAGNEVIINSEVWDLRTFKLLRSVSSLDQTAITFNTTGDVIYAILRRPDDVTLAFQGKRNRHPLFGAFRTMDTVDYTDIGTTHLDKCVLDLATHYNESQIALVAMDTIENMETSVKVYEVGRRRPTDDDSDPDDGMDTEDEEDESDGDDDDERARLIAQGESSDSSRGLSDMSTTDSDEEVEVFHYFPNRNEDEVEIEEDDEEDEEEDGERGAFEEFDEDGEDGIDGILHGFL